MSLIWTISSISAGFERKFVLHTIFAAVPVGPAPFFFSHRFSAVLELSLFFGVRARLALASIWFVLEQRTLHWQPMGKRRDDQPGRLCDVKLLPFQGFVHCEETPQNHGF